MKHWTSRCAGLVFAGACVFVASCANNSDSVVTGKIESSRIVENAQIDFAAQPTHAERFGLVSGATPPVEASSAAKGIFAWKTPPGWVELPASSMRAANFRPAGDERTECYLTLLTGEAGGLTANINRWRAQLAMPGLSAEEVEQLPRIDFFGRKAVLAGGTGTWRGMTGSDTKTDWALLGVALVDPNGSIFLKMTGPMDIVAAEREAFIALAASFGADGRDDTTNRGGGFEFELPSEWRRTSDKASRSLSFWAGEDDTVECYVTVLGGQAGGELANVNRWRAQIGLDAVDQTAIDALEPFTLLERPAHVVEIEGPLTATYGITCMGDDRSIFLKMTGPVGGVRRQRAAMLTFAASLKASS